jgi:hypothetical protein
MKISDKAQASINKVIAKFQSGDISPISRVLRIQLDPKAPARFWSLSNKVLAFIQAEELDCRGYMQWQQLGRSVKHGSKAVYIVRPLTVKKTKEEDGEQKDYVACIGFSTFPVFAASDTEGGTEISQYQPMELPPLLDIAKQFNISVDYVPVAPDRYGDTNINGNKIRLGSKDPSVFFHELTHAIHARINGGLKGGQQVDQEVIAEFCATVLMDFYGFTDHTGNAWDYISHYAEEPLLAITKALGTVEQVMSVLLNENSEVKI